MEWIVGYAEYTGWDLSVFFLSLLACVLVRPIFSYRFVMIMAQRDWVLRHCVA